MAQKIEVGRLLRAGTAGFVVGCRVSQIDGPAFGALVRAHLGEAYEVFGLIHDIRIDDDGLIRQLATAESVSDEVLRDNRERRIVPVELSVVALGYEDTRGIHHLLPPRPPLSLDLIYLCDAAEISRFTSAGHFGYFRHLLGRPDLPVGDLLAAHILQAHAARDDGDAWKRLAIQEVVALLRGDYETLTSVLGALNQAV
jgi:hypothetical protein